MIDTAASFATSAAQLRREFDLAFAEPLTAQTRSADPFVILRVADDLRIAVSARDLGGLHKCPPILRLPDADAAAQLGIVGVHGELIVAYSLNAALDRASRVGGWLALWARDRSIGFVFDAVEGYVQYGEDGVRRHDRSAAESASSVLQLPSGTYSIVSIAALAAMLGVESRESRAPAEH